MKKFIVLFLLQAVVLMAFTITESGGGRYGLLIPSTSVEQSENDSSVEKAGQSQEQENPVQLQYNVPENSSSSGMHDGDIAVMHIIKRSDWVDVKAFGAKGDGVHDDTSAIQQALNRLKTDRTKSGVYFPAGTYIIKETLTIGGGLLGKTIVGHGKDTVIKWEGSTNKPMLISKGAGYSSYKGLTWDGNNVASIGILHHSNSIFETFMEHYNEAFRNLRQAGIEVYGGSASGDLAAAEAYVHNCLFDNTHYGLNIGTNLYNAYDWVIDQCEIRNNKIGIRAPKGQFFVYNTHFYNNSETDILAQNGVYIRRVTSEKSYMFYKDNTFSSAGIMATFEDIHVDGWTNPRGIAIDYGYRGPMMLVNSSFTHSPKPSVPPVNIQGRDFVWTQHVTTSNNYYDGSAPLMDKSKAAIFVDIPAKNKKTVIADASTVFLDSTSITENSLIEVGGNDASSIQKAIDIAADRGNGTIVYMPARDYYIDRTINVHGENYTIEGAGLSSAYYYRNGKANDVYFLLDNANKVTMKNMRLSLQHGEIGILQNSDGDNVFHRMITKDAWTNADKTLFKFSNLSSDSKILMKYNSGKVVVENSSDANIFAKMHLGKIHIKGRRGNGLIGFRWLNGLNVRVDDNNNLVIGDFYTEQGERIFDINGGGSRPGRITIGGARRIHGYNKKEGEYLHINDYLGEFVVMEGSFDKTSRGAASQIVLSQSPSSNRIRMVLWGVGFTNRVAAPAYKIDIENGEVDIIQSSVMEDGRQKQYDIPNDALSSSLINTIQNALEDLYILGKYDLDN